MQYIIMKYSRKCSNKIRLGSRNVTATSRMVKTINSMLWTDTVQHKACIMGNISSFGFFRVAQMKAVKKQTWRRVKVTQSLVIEPGEDLRAANEELRPKRGGFFCRMDVVQAWKVWHGPENRTLKVTPQTGPHSRLKHHLPLLPPTQGSHWTAWRESTHERPQR